VNYNDMTRMVAGRTALTKRRSDEVLVATLTVLSEAISPNETKDLLAQLPKSVRERVPVTGESIKMRPIEFVARVADLVESATVDEAEGYVRAVFATVYEAVNSGEMRDIADELGGEFVDLLGVPRPAPASVDTVPRDEAEPVNEAAPDGFQTPTPEGTEAPTPHPPSDPPTLVVVLGSALTALIRVPGAVLGRVAQLLQHPGKA
jgi:uncharacterized protein (DUF2267 family)